MAGVNYRWSCLGVIRSRKNPLCLDLGRSVQLGARLILALVRSHDSLVIELGEREEKRREERKGIGCFRIYPARL
jgi:hypothetical protein